MTKSIKKALLVFLSIIICISMLSGCDKSSKTYENSMYNPDIAKKVGDTGGLKLPLDINDTVITTVVSSEYNLNESYFAESIRKATGVNFQIDSSPSSTIGAVMLASVTSNSSLQ